MCYYTYMITLIVIGATLDTRKHNVFGDIDNDAKEEVSTMNTINSERTDTTNEITTGESELVTTTAGTGDIKSTTEKKLSHLYKYVNREQLGKRCEEVKVCPSSEVTWIVCGSDDINYQNLGLLACAQRCDKSLKLKGFGPCKNSEPLDAPTFPTLSISTTSGPIAKELRDLTNDDENEILQYMIDKIKIKHDHHSRPPEVEEWCRDNPDECPFGYDPTINREVYIIPATPYEEQNVLPP